MLNKIFDSLYIISWICKKIVCNANSREKNLFFTFVHEKQRWGRWRAGIKSRE